MDDMDKHYGGHVWTKTQTTNSSIDLGLAFGSSTCVGHLEYQNPHCDYLQRAHRISSVKDIKFDGFTKEPFPVGCLVPAFSILVYKICREPLKCIAPCVAKIFYIHDSDTTQWACIHLGNHRHFVKVGNCRDSRKHIDTLIEEHIEQTPQATHKKIVLEASKDLVGEFLLHNDSDPHHLLSLEELEPVFDRCKELKSPHLHNKVRTFKYLCRLRVMDGIAKLRGVNTWAYVQRNQSRTRVTKQTKFLSSRCLRLANGIDLVRRMQHGRDLKHALIMSDHVKQVAKWVTMACHIYDGTYQCIMTIACCDFQSKDKDAQVFF